MAERFTKNTAILLGIGTIFGLIVGLLVGFLTGSPAQEEPSVMADQWKSDNSAEGGERNVKAITSMISAKNIGENIKELSKEPHLAGTARDNELALLVQRRFQDAGFDSVEMPSMNFLLSRPDSDNPNLVRVYDSQNATTFTSHYKEEPLHKDDENKDFVHAFNAYTPAGDVWSSIGEGVVYVNYGRIEDFEKLEELGVTAKGKIALMRYGKIYRGNKVTHASQFGAIGAILYSDPEDVARSGQTPQDVYPNTEWLPGTGMQRGNAFVGDGDPLTPGWPSMDSAYRLSDKDISLPTIPSQPIGYADAEQLLNKLGGDKAPADWQGKIAGVVYNIGPQMSSEYSEYRVRLTSNNKLVDVKSYNVIGTIKGSVEPDRYVFIGNHRDAWGYGASDPSSGTAQLLETARVIGHLIKQGWRPRRTLVFCSWGAEEYGLIGSTEWVEQHVDKLQGRAVAYINTDTCASGPHVQLKGSPLLWDAMKYIADMVPGVLDPAMSLLDEWIANDRMTDPDAQAYPIFKTLGSGSDYAAFLFYAGIPGLDIWFRRDQSSHGGTYATYHTGYDTYFNLANNTDRGFKVMQGCGRFAILTLKYISDSLILPFNLERFSVTMKKTLDSYEKDGTAKRLEDIYEKYHFFVEAVDMLTSTVQFFQNKAVSTDSFVAVRSHNDQLAQFERMFILPTGLPGRPSTRHAVFAPSKFDNYASAAFPGISDLLYDYDKLSGQNRTDRGDLIKRHVSDLTIMTHRAIGLLDDIHKF